MTNDPKNHSESAYHLMHSALFELMAADPSRANSLAKTNLEQAMMWCEHDMDVKRYRDDPAQPIEPLETEEDR